MDLTLPEAARVLGKTQRQVRYMILQGKLKGTKDGGRWAIPHDSLPLTETEVMRRLRENTKLRGVLEGALGVRDGELRKTYSVSRLRSFQAGLDITAELRAAVGAEAPVAQRAAQAMGLISCGCHTYHKRDKVVYLQRAREQLCFVVSDLILEGTERSVLLAERVESEWLTLLSGLIRAAEQKR